MLFVDERIARVQTESLEIYNTTEITKRDYSDSVVTALSDDRSQRGESAGADYVDSTVQSGQTKTVPTNSIPSLSGFQVGATGKRLQGLENMVAELTRNVPGAEIPNKHTKEADAGFVAAWNYIRDELGNSPSIKSFSNLPNHISRTTTTTRDTIHLRSSRNVQTAVTMPPNPHASHVN